MSDKYELKPCPWCRKVPTHLRQHFKHILLHNCDAIKCNTGWMKSKRELFDLWNGPLKKCALYVDYEKSCQALKERKREQNQGGRNG